MKTYRRMTDMELLAAVEVASGVAGCGRYNNSLSRRAVETVPRCAMKPYRRTTDRVLLAAVETTSSVDGCGRYNNIATLISTRRQLEAQHTS